MCRHRDANLIKHLRCSILTLTADPQPPAAPLTNVHHDDARLKTSAELFNHGSVPHTPAGQPITCGLSVGGTASSWPSILHHMIIVEASQPKFCHHAPSLQTTARLFRVEP